MLDLLPLRRRSLSCGIVVLLDTRELLLCHVTGQRHWDLPKGGIERGETECAAALRETREETGLRFDAERLLDLGRHAYTAKKDLHLFACVTERHDPAARCIAPAASSSRSPGRARPEMDGFGWFAFDRIGALCTPRLARVLTARLDLDGPRRPARRRAERAPRGLTGGAGRTAQRESASLMPKPIMNTPAARPKTRPMRGSARMRSARRCVSSVTTAP